MKILEILKKAKTLLSSVKLSQDTLDDGKTVIEFDGDAIAVGSIVYSQDSAGNWSVIADGDYTTKSGLKFTVANGIVSAIDNSAVTASKTEETKQVEETKEVKQAAGDTTNTTVDTVATIDLQKMVEEKLQPLW